MNLEIDDTNKINSYCQEAKRMGLEILPPDINRSDAKFTDLDGKINYALGSLKNVGVKAVEGVVKERAANGLFKDIFDFVERCSGGGINKRMMENLAKSGSFVQIHENRHEALHNCEVLIRHGANLFNQKNTAQIGLFGDSSKHISNPRLSPVVDWNFEEALEAEFDAFGFYLSRHPLEAYAIKLSKIRVVESTQVESYATFKGSKISIAGVVISKKIRSSKRGKFAFIQLSDRSGLLEVSLFNEQLLTQKEELLEPGSKIFCRIDARKDENGLKAIIESIESIDQALRNITTTVDVIVSDINKIEEIKTRIAPAGKIMNLILKLPSGESIVFNSKAPMYLDEEGEGYLMKVHGVEIFEH